jgi:hypothetical protein
MFQARRWIKMLKHPGLVDRGVDDRGDGLPAENKLAAEVPSSTVANTTTKAELLTRAKGLIERGDQSFQEAAEALAIAREVHKATQREMAEGIGRSVGWVNALLQWHSFGDKDASPFGPTTKADRVQHAEQRAASKIHEPRNANSPKAVNAELPNAKGSAADAGAANTKMAVIENANANTIEPVDVRSDAAETANAKTSKANNDAAKALAEFKYAVDLYVPKMNFEGKCEATAYLHKKTGARVSCSNK